MPDVGSSWKLALAQMRVDGGRPQENLGRAVRRIRDAAERGAALVVLPEALDLGWTHPATTSLATAIPDGASCRALAEAARLNGVYVCAGLVERCGDRCYNAAVLLGPTGEVLLRHRKLNELEIGHGLYAQGDRLGVVSTPLGTVGLMICADAFARGQVVARTLGLMGAHLILCPSAWAVPPNHDNVRDPYGRLWKDNFGPVARDFRLWIAGVSCVGTIEAGPWAGRQCIGCSLVVGPQGEVALQGPYGADADVLLEVAVLPVERPARGDGWERVWGGSR